MRQTINQTYQEIKAAYAFTMPIPTIMPDPMVMDYTERNGRKEGLLYNNRIHWMTSGDGNIVPTGFGSTEQYNVNRDWILANFKK